jgi:hypothetical protein
MALNAYITQVQQLLHDPNAQYWSTAQLTNYINLARNRVAQDTKCLRQVMAGYTLTAGQEQYLIANLPVNYASRVIDIMNIDLYWGNVRRGLMYKPWTQFSAQYRSWQNVQQQPECYTRMGALSVYFGPNPDQAYVTDWIIAINPNPLVTDVTVEEIPVPFTDCIQFFAAYMAKFQEQAMGEANIYLEQYNQWLRRVQRSFMTRVIADPYNSGA